MPRVYLNGTYIDATATRVQAGCKLLEHDFRGLPGEVNAFANGNYTNPSRQGGDDLCEAVVFTNRLTETERLRVANRRPQPSRGRAEPEDLPGPV